MNPTRENATYFEILEKLIEGGQAISTTFHLSRISRGCPDNVTTPTDPGSSAPRRSEYEIELVRVIGDSDDIRFETCGKVLGIAVFNTESAPKTFFHNCLISYTIF